MRRPQTPMRPSRGRTQDARMDLLAIVIAVVCFAVLALIVEGLDRV
jgi:hypothetical protein